MNLVYKQTLFSLVPQNTNNLHEKGHYSAKLTVWYAVNHHGLSEVKYKSNIGLEESLQCFTNIA